MVSLTSGNTFGQNLWTDGYNHYPMMPELSAVQRCPHCDTYSLLDKWQRTDNADPETYGTTGNIQYYESKDAFLQLRDTAFTRNERFEIGIFFVHAFNSEFRRPRIVSAFEQNISMSEVWGTYPSPDDDDYALFDDALQMSLDNIPEDADHLLLKAELFRNMGEWGKAIETIDRIRDCQNKWIADIIKYLALTENSEVHPLVINGTKLNYSQRSNFDTLVNFRGLPHNSDREMAVSQYVSALPSRVVKDVDTDRLGGVYDRHSKTLLRLCEPSFERYEIEAGTENIGEFALLSNFTIKELRLPTTLHSIGVKGLWGCKNLESIEVPSGCIEVLGNAAFMNCKSLTAIEFLSNLKFLGTSVFAGMDKLERIILPDSLSTIPRFSFFMCESLTKIDIPTYVQFIDSYAFECTALRQISLPDMVQGLGHAVFSMCKQLESVRLPAKLKNIPDRTFSSCSRLENIEIPSSIESIGAAAFEDCKALHSVRFGGKVSTIAKDAFKGTNISEIIVPLRYFKHYKRLFPGTRIRAKFV